MYRFEVSDYTLQEERKSSFLKEWRKGLEETVHKNEGRKHCKAHSSVLNNSWSRLWNLQTKQQTFESVTL